MIAWVCGDVCIWKTIRKSTDLWCGMQKIVQEVFAANNVPEGVSCLVNGDASVGQWMTEDHRLPLISATGSTRMGKAVAATVGARLGKTILELGGNNAIIVSEHADIKMTTIGAVFGAVGTCGQRCTSTRRLIIHSSKYDQVKDALVQAYAQLKIGNPLDATNHIEPLIDTDAVKMYSDALENITKHGGKFVVEGGVLQGAGYESGCYVKPAIAEVEPNNPMAEVETFAPILYLMKYDNLKDAIDIQNSVPSRIVLSDYDSECP